MPRLQRGGKHEALIFARPIADLEIKRSAEGDSVIRSDLLTRATGSLVQPPRKNRLIPCALLTHRSGIHARTHSQPGLGVPEMGSRLLLGGVSEQQHHVVVSEQETSTGNSGIITPGRYTGGSPTMAGSRQGRRRRRAALRASTAGAHGGRSLLLLLLLPIVALVILGLLPRAQGQTPG